MAHAETIDTNEKKDTFAQLIFPTDDTLKPTVMKVEQSVKAATKPVPEPPKPVEYVVVEGDYLDKIARDKSTTWLRLWQKNTNIQDPDRIFVGDKLIIPAPDEQLADRALPEAVAVASTTSGLEALRTAVRGSSSGNTYDAGYCTWYVKNRRPDLPNNLGNADTWFARAQEQGLPTGYSPRTGSAAQVKGRMHVVYVEGVNGDGTIVISEMNYAGLYSLRTVTVSASDYLYIY